MATQKEMAIVVQVVEVAAKVNASSERVNVAVDITRSGVSVCISDPVIVSANYEGTSWDWLFYDNGPAYFSSEIFSEDEFIKRCQEFIAEINGFEGYAGQEQSK